MPRARWSWSVGPYGCRVRVFETRSGILYGETRIQGRGRRESLGHRDRERAKAWATRTQAELALGLKDLDAALPTAARVFEGFLAVRSPMKRTAAGQQNDQRAAALWRAVLGDGFNLATLSDVEWSRFIRARQAGAIDAHGRAVAPAKRAPVRARTVGADLEWLRSVVHWAMRARDPAGRYYLRENPIRGLPIPHEPNPRRPVASLDRFEALRAVSDRVTTATRHDGQRVTIRSDLSEILDLVHGTGRRISAVLQLRYEDLRLEDGPHGAIYWRADADKMGRAWCAPINADVRAALDRILCERPGIGRAWLFPSPLTPHRPVSKRLALSWLRRAEDLAKLPRVAGSGFHAFRRGWATARKHLPPRDVAQAGGWKDLHVLQATYQAVDDATLYRVVSEPAELRERRHG